MSMLRTLDPYTEYQVCVYVCFYCCLRSSRIQPYHTTTSPFLSGRVRVKHCCYRIVLTAMFVGDRLISNAFQPRTHTTRKPRERLMYTNFTSRDHFFDRSAFRAFVDLGLFAPNFHAYSPSRMKNSHRNVVPLPQNNQAAADLKETVSGRYGGVGLVISGGKPQTERRSKGGETGESIERILCR